MAKTNTIQHVKVFALADLLGMESWAALGLLEALFDWAHQNVRDGDLTKYSPSMIADGVKWKGDPRILMHFLRSVGVIDALTDGILYIHDYHDHCPDYVRRWLERAGKTFANGFPPRMPTEGYASTGLISPRPIPYDAEAHALLNAGHATAHKSSAQSQYAAHDEAQAKRTVSARKAANARWAKSQTQTSADVDIVARQTIEKTPVVSRQPSDSDATVALQSRVDVAARTRVTNPIQSNPSQTPHTESGNYHVIGEGSKTDAPPETAHAGTTQSAEISLSNSLGDRTGTGPEPEEPPDEGPPPQTSEEKFFADVKRLAAKKSLDRTAGMVPEDVEAINARRRKLKAQMGISE